MVSGNIKSGVKIFNVTGSMAPAPTYMSKSNTYTTEGTFTFGLTSEERMALYAYSASGTLEAAAYSSYDPVTVSVAKTNVDPGSTNITIHSFCPLIQYNGGNDTLLLSSSGSYRLRNINITITLYYQG